MDRLSAAIAELERMSGYDLEGNDPLAATALRQWAGDVCAALAALREQEGWVKCSDRLPTAEDGYVLAFRPYYGGNIDRVWWSDVGRDHPRWPEYNATHWHPIPAAPQPEEAL